MNSIQLPPINPLLNARIEPQLMKDTYKKVHVYLFDFELVLGKGSFSKVYKGVNLNTNEQVAVKVIEMGSINTPKLKQLLLQQIDILMKIKHQNLIKCFEVLSSSKNTYIIMQLCTYDLGSVCQYIQKLEHKTQSSLQTSANKDYSSQDMRDNSSSMNNKFSSQKIRSYHKKQMQSILSSSTNSISSTKSVQFNQSDQMIENKVTLKQEKFYPYIKQIFEGLEYLHKQNIVHRDLKLSNIFLTANKACKIGDFGFATIIPSNQSQIKDTCCIGSPLYMSPQSYLENVYSLKSDIWSFGILVFEMIYGNPPHWNCPTHEVLKSEIKRQIDLKKFQKLAQLSDEMKEVLDGCLQVDVQKRFSIAELKQTRLFKKLCYQPEESFVISNKKENKSIQESNVLVFDRTLMRNDSVRPFDIEQFRINNFSNNQNPRQSLKENDTLQKDREFLTKGRQLRRHDKCQTINPFDNPAAMLNEISNNSSTDRFNNEFNNPRKPPILSKQDLSFKFQNYEQRYRSPEFVFTKQSSKYQERNQSPSFSRKTDGSYRNSQSMQKYLKEMDEKKKAKQIRQFDLSKNYNDSMTFQDLSKILGSSKGKSDQESNQQKQKESPRFASNSGNQFYSPSRYERQRNNTLIQKNYSRTAENFMPIKKDEDNLMTKNLSMLDSRQRSPRQFTAFSPRNDSSYHYYFKKDSKQNSEKESLLSKNYSVGQFTTNNKSYLGSKVPERYEYKTKILEKCTSSPKFEPMQNDSHDREYKSIDKNPKYMTTSSFYGTSSSKNQDKSFNSVKESKNKQDYLKNKDKSQFLTKKYQTTNNFLSQFSSKMNENPSHIQKRSYWKGANHKNFTINLGDKEEEVKQNQNNRNSLNSTRNNTFLYATSEDEKEKPPTTKKSEFSKPVVESQISLFCQAFKLLNGEIIIKDACELIHFSRLLHKLSFATESNSSSILLLQYSIQILSNLLEKCENFEIKYHYESSTGKSVEIRQAFKANDACLNNLAAVNEKECYAIKKEISINQSDSNSIGCNKTLQLKAIILSYIKKYMQRKQALMKLFQCNAMFENLTNKVKDAKSISRNERSTNVKKSSFSERGFLNFTKLQKTLSQIQNQISNKKDLFSVTGSKQSGINSKTLINVALVQIDAISKCVYERSFIKLQDNLKDGLKYVSKTQFQIFKILSKNEQPSGKSLIERILEGFNLQQKSALKQNQQGLQKERTLSKNLSLLVLKSGK